MVAPTDDDVVEVVFGGIVAVEPRVDVAAVVAGGGDEELALAAGVGDGVVEGVAGVAAGAAPAVVGDAGAVVGGVADGLGDAGGRWPSRRCRRRSARPSSSTFQATPLMPTPLLPIGADDAGGVRAVAAVGEPSSMGLLSFSAKSQPMMSST